MYYFLSCDLFYIHYSIKADHVIFQIHASNLTAKGLGSKCRSSAYIFQRIVVSISIHSCPVIHSSRLYQKGKIRAYYKMTCSQRVFSNFFRFHRSQSEAAGHLLAHRLLTEKVRSDEVTSAGYSIYCSEYSGFLEH